MPHATLSREVIANAVLLAGRAPSVHNSQPWRWVFENATLRLYVDPHRRVRHTDRTGREAIISCGAVLDHLCVAMTAAGWQAHVERLPKPRDPNHLASIDFTPLEVVTDVQRRRAEADAATADRSAPAGLSDLLGVVRTGAVQQRCRGRHYARGVAR